MSTSSVDLDAVWTAMHEGSTIPGYLREAGLSGNPRDIRKELAEKHGRAAVREVIQEKIMKTRGRGNFRPLALPELQKERMAACKGCEKFLGMRECGACGCPVANLVAYSNGKCPHPEGPRWR